MSMFPGLTGLGVKVTWEFAFVAHGSRVPAIPGQVCVDVGRDLGPGVLDHHHLESGSAKAASCASLLVRDHAGDVFRHLATPILEKHSRGDEVRGLEVTFRIVTHRQPDWDSVVASYLIQHLIEHGDLPPCQGELVKYAEKVDQGAFTIQHYGEIHPAAQPLLTPGNVLDDETRLAGFLTLPHVVYLMVGNLKDNKEPRYTDDAALQLGLKLVKQLDGAYPAKGIRNEDERFVFLTSAGTWIADAPQFTDLLAALHDDHATWKDESKHAEPKCFKLPCAKTGTLKSVAGIALQQDSKSALNKYWARAEGYILFVCPYNIIKPDTKKRSAVIISVPEISQQTEPVVTLEGLARALEREECTIRGTGDIRPKKVPRYPDVTNEDPWYNGSDKNYTICDAPGQGRGTHLDYDTILNTIKEPDKWANPDVRFAEMVLDVFIEQAASPQTEELKPLGNDDLISGHRTKAFSRSLDTWWNDLRQTEPGSSPETPPSGLSLAYDRILGLRREKITNPTLTPDVRWIRLQRDRKAKEGPSLGAIQKWKDSVTAQGSLSHYCVWHWKADPTACPDTLAGAKLLAAGLIPVKGEGGWVYRNRIVQGPVQGAPDVANAAILNAAVLTLYTAMVDFSLVNASNKVSELASVSGGSIDLQKQFLNFQGRHYQLSISSDSDLNNLWSQMWGDLAIKDHYSEIESEITSLASLEVAQSNERQQKLLGFLAAWGVVQGVDTLIQAFKEPSSMRFWGGIVSLCLACLLLLFFFFCPKWLSRLDRARRKRGKRSAK